MSVIHDLICTACDTIERDQLVEVGEYGSCEECGAERTWLPSGFHTDVFGAPQYSDATGQMHTSQREKEKVMRDAGYQVAGDPVGGARPHHKIEGTVFSYSGQKVRRSADRV